MSLPQGWASVSLGEIRFDDSAGLDPKESPTHMFELYSVPQFDSRRPEIIMGRQIGSNKQTVADGTVLLCKINPRINRVWVVKRQTTHTAIASTEWIPFFPIEELNPHYLAYFLQQGWVREYLATNVSGVGGSLMRVRPAIADKIQFLIAPRWEQDRIVAEIEKQFTRLDDAMAALKRVQSNLKRYRASVLKAACEGRLVPTEAQLARKEGRDYEPAGELLKRILAERRAKWESDQLAKMIAAGRPPKDNEWKKKYKEPEPPDMSSLPELPEGWLWATVDHIGEVQGGIQKQPKRAPKDNAYPYLRVANVYRGELDLSQIEYMELFGNEIDTLRLKTADLLIVEGNGSPNEIGRMAIWRGEIENCVHQNHIIRVRLTSGIGPEFCMAYWNSPAGSRRVMNVASSTSGLHTLSVSKIQRLVVPIAPVGEQQRLITEMNRRLSVLQHDESAIFAQVEKAQRLRAAILHRAFSGKLVPQDPNDEPASVLLERIRAERAQQAASKPAPKPRAKREKAIAVEA